MAIDLGLVGIFQKTKECVNSIIVTIVASATLIIKVSLIVIGIVITYKLFSKYKKLKKFRFDVPSTKTIWLP